MIRPHITLTQEQIDGGTALNDINNFFAETDAELEKISDNIQEQEIFQLGQNPGFPFFRKYALLLDGKYITIDENDFDVQSKYDQTIVDNKIKITNTGENYLIVQVQLINNSLKFTYNDGSGEQVLTAEAGDNSFDKVYLILPQQQYVIMPAEIDYKHVQIFSVFTLPFILLRVFPTTVGSIVFDDRLDYHIEAINPDYTVDELFTHPTETYKIEEDITRDMLTDGADNAIDWLNTFILTGSSDQQEDGIQYGKYAYSYVDGVYNKYTVTLTQIGETDEYTIIKAQDQQTGYNVFRPYTHITEYGNEMVYEIPITQCTFHEPDIRFIGGSNQNKIEISNQTNRISVTDIPDEVTGDFLVVSIVDNALDVQYFESKDVMDKDIEYTSVPQKTWILYSMSGMTINEGGQIKIRNQHISQQVVFVNPTTDPVTIVSNTSRPEEEELNYQSSQTAEENTTDMVGGAKEDFVKIYLKEPLQAQEFILQNHTEQQQTIFQFIIEYRAVQTPRIFTNYGYSYYIYAEKNDSEDIGIFAQYISTQTKQSQVIGFIQQRLKPTVEENYISVTHKIKVKVSPIDAINDMPKFILAKRINRIYNLKVFAKPGVLYYSPIELGIHI